MTRRVGGARRLWFAAGAGVAAFVVARLVMAVFLAAFACPAPGSRWPAWAALCGDDGAVRVANAMLRLGWDGALPLLIGVATFLAIGLTRGAH